ncbi:MAG: hypothetical protein HOY79_00340 [Streptomyces sp.]|nr:hypothetical protein [Streptomyces sp.]
MTMPGDATELRLLAWNIFVGGIDGEDEGRRLQQLAYLKSIVPLDLLWIIEATGWHQDDDRRFDDVTSATGLTALPPVTSHIGDQRNHSVMYYRASRLTPTGQATQLARGAFHHGVSRIAFQADGVPLLALGAHLSYAGGAPRLSEAHHLADYGRQFAPWPEDGVLLMDSNAPDDTDPEPDDWSAVPQNLWHRYREVRADGSFGGFDRSARRLLLNSGWRDPQTAVSELREPTVGYWYDNERVPLRLDQALVTGPRIEVVDYRTLNPEVPDLTKLADHLPVLLVIRLHRHPVTPPVGNAT